MHTHHRAPACVTGCSQAHDHGPSPPTIPVFAYTIAYCGLLTLCTWASSGPQRLYTAYISLYTACVMTVHNIDVCVCVWVCVFVMMCVYDQSRKCVQFRYMSLSAYRYRYVRISFRQPPFTMTNSHIAYTRTNHTWSNTIYSYESYVCIYICMHVYLCMHASKHACIH